MLTVAGSAYDSAAEAWAAGNLRAVDVLDDLAAGLSSSAGMAGDDATSEDFAASYDDGAREVVAALGDLTEAFATIAVLTDASSQRHRAADAHATIGAPEWVGLGYGDRGVVAPSHGPPPSALGGDNGSAPAMWNLVVDHLQRWTWPSADVDQLRQTAQLWHHTGDRVRDLTASLAVGESALADQRSPEVPLALAASAELRGHTETLAEQCHDLAQGCADDADRVEATRQAVIDLLEDLAIELAVTGAISLGVGLITFGIGASAGALAATARAVVCARRIINVLRTLRSTRAVSVAAHTLPELRGVRTGLATFRNLEHVIDSSRGTKDAHWFVPRKLRKLEDGGAANLKIHFERHGSDFPQLRDSHELDRFARRFLSDPPAGTRTIVRSDGSVVRWHERSNIFAVMDSSGAPQTIYKLDTTLNRSHSNLDYFLSQLDR